jgi:hypothetical protein
VQVSWGASQASFDLGGMTVGEAFDLLQGPLGIPPGLDTLVNRLRADADRRLVAGDTLEWVHRGGEKGRA